LFSATIRENIRYGKIDASQEEIILAAKGADIHDFIMTLPEQYDTPITSTSLSGGQKQRICIARCLIRKPRLLLCDEATSALDSKSEKMIEETIKVASKHCTTIIIAHRLSTIRTADLIAVIERGQMVEMGTHDELMSKKASYYALVHAQA
jgi:ABC-type multidrug transport system fused ATPase/permease subunit